MEEEGVNLAEMRFWLMLQRRWRSIPQNELKLLFNSLLSVVQMPSTTYSDEKKCVVFSMYT